MTNQLVSDALGILRDAAKGDDDCFPPNLAAAVVTEIERLRAALATCRRFHYVVRGIGTRMFATQEREGAFAHGALYPTESEARELAEINMAFDALFADAAEPMPRYSDQTKSPRCLGKHDWHDWGGKSYRDLDAVCVRPGCGYRPWA